MSSRAIITLAAIILLHTLASPVNAQGGLAGRWAGAIEVMGQKLDILVALAGDEGALTGTIDIPQQRAHGLPLTNVKADGQRVHFELKAGPGVAVFDGERKGERIEGSFEQAGMKGTFSVAPASPERAAPRPLTGRKK
ncbi:MAG TPA: hypothetical protein VK911_15605 [Vicinamibacterales bacterium]|nr:hypothetical protein [Vicinamibacterales bacterium]